MHFKILHNLVAVVSISWSGCDTSPAYMLEPLSEPPQRALEPEVIEVGDSRLTYTPDVFTCNPGEWCHALDSWSINRLSRDGRFTHCEGEAECSASSVELALDGNVHRSVILSHWDSPESRIIAVELSLDGGSTYTFHRAINTHRVRVQEPKTSTLHTIASNLPIGIDVRVRLVAAKGRMNIEGFALSEMILPESDTKPFRSIARASGNGTDDTCDLGGCGPLDARQLIFVKTQDQTDVRVQYTDVLRAVSEDGTDRACRWSIRFNGSDCPEGSIHGDVFANDLSLENNHFPGAVAGYCQGLAANVYSVQVFVEQPPSSGFPERPGCFTGWEDSRWLLEAEEVQ